jgi:uncharacterized protein (TIGR02246 family)
MREILIAAILLVAPTYAAANPEAEAAIKTAVGRIDTCINDKDSKCLGELFVDDATFGGPIGGGRIVSGKAAVLRMFEDLMKEPTPEGVKQVRSVEKIRFIGQDSAFVDSSVKLVGSKEVQGTRQDWHSTMLMKLQDGKWLLEDVRFYVVETGAPPTPGPTPPPTKAAGSDEPAEADEPAGADEPTDQPGDPAPPSMG